MQQHDVQCFQCTVQKPPRHGLKAIIPPRQSYQMEVVTIAPSVLKQLSLEIYVRAV